MRIDKSALELLRAKNCMSASELTRVAKISSGTLQRAQNGDVNPKVVGKLAAALGVDPEDIIVKEQRGNAQGNSAN